jgi:hypothetical protein
MTYQSNVSDALTNNEAPTAPSAPSIASSSMLVELSISTWTARKLDKRASQDVTTQNHAASGVANVKQEATWRLRRTRRGTEVYR